MATTYHTGFLAIDRRIEPGMSHEAKAAARDLGRKASHYIKMAAEGQVFLVQRRIDEMVFEYIAIEKGEVKRPTHMSMDGALTL